MGSSLNSWRTKGGQGVSCPPGPGRALAQDGADGVAGDEAVAVDQGRRSHRGRRKLQEIQVAELPVFRSSSTWITLSMPSTAKLLTHSAASLSPPLRAQPMPSGVAADSVLDACARAGWAAEPCIHRGWRWHRQIGALVPQRAALTSPPAGQGVIKNRPISPGLTPWRAA